MPRFPKPTAALAIEIPGRARLSTAALVHFVNALNAELPNLNKKQRDGYSVCHLRLSEDHGTVEFVIETEGPPRFAKVRPNWRMIREITTADRHVPVYEQQDELAESTTEMLAREDLAERIDEGIKGFTTQKVKKGLARAIATTLLSDAEQKPSPADPDGEREPK